jgi:hypothetical protein
MRILQSRRTQRTSQTPRLPGSAVAVGLELVVPANDRAGENAGSGERSTVAFVERSAATIGRALIGGGRAVARRVAEGALIGASCS